MLSHFFKVALLRKGENVSWSLIPRISETAILDWFIGSQKPLALNGARMITCDQFRGLPQRRFLFLFPLWVALTYYWLSEGPLTSSSRSLTSLNLLKCILAIVIILITARILAKDDILIPEYQSSVLFAIQSSGISQKLSRFVTKSPLEWWVCV